MATMFKTIIRRFLYTVMHDEMSLCGTKFYDVIIYQAKPKGDLRSR